MNDGRRKLRQKRGYERTIQENALLPTVFFCHQMASVNHTVRFAIDTSVSSSVRPFLFRTTRTTLSGPSFRFGFACAVGGRTLAALTQIPSECGPVIVQLLFKRSHFGGSGVSKELFKTHYGSGIFPDVCVMALEEGIGGVSGSGCRVVQIKPCE